MFSLREWAGLLFKQAREDLGYSQQYVADVCFEQVFNKQELVSLTIS